MHWHDLADPTEADHGASTECAEESLASCVLRVVDLLHSFATTHDVRLRAEIDALKARLQSIEDLQTDRNVPVHLLNEVARLSPEGLQLKSLVQTGADVVLTGVAQSNERVSELLRNVSLNGQWLERPELIEVKSSLADVSARERGRVYEFSLRLKVKRPNVEPVPKTPAGPPSS